MNGALSFLWLAFCKHQSLWKIGKSRHDRSEWASLSTRTCVRVEKILLRFWFFSWCCSPAENVYGHEQTKLKGFSCSQCFVDYEAPRNAWKDQLDAPSQIALSRVGSDMLDWTLFLQKPTFRRWGQWMSHFCARQALFHKINPIFQNQHDKCKGPSRGNKVKNSLEIFDCHCSSCVLRDARESTRPVHFLPFVQEAVFSQPQNAENDGQSATQPDPLCMRVGRVTWANCPSAPTWWSPMQPHADVLRMNFTWRVSVCFRKHRFT